MSRSYINVFTSLVEEWNHTSNVYLNVGVLVIAFLGSILLGMAGVPVIRPVITSLVLSTAFGLLALLVLGTPIHRSEEVIYVVAASISLLMTFGLLVYWFFTVAIGVLVSIRPFSMGILAAGISLSMLAAAYAISRAQPSITVQKFHLMRFDRKWFLLFAAQLPLFAIVAAVIDRGLSLGPIVWYSTNLPRIGVILLVALLPVLIVVADIPEKYVPFSIWAGATALLLQNTLSTYYFTGGDAGVEYFLAKLTMVHGIWDPLLKSTKITLLRINMLHPMYSIIGNYDLMIEMKIVHPVLLAFTFPALYKIYCRQFSQTTSMLGTFLVLFLHPFFTLLTQNSRSGTAIFFMVCTVLVFVDSGIGDKTRAVLSMIFIFGLIVSHYGVAMMFLAMASLAFVGNRLNDRIRWSNHTTERRVAYTSLLFFSTFLVSWYMFVAHGVVFWKLMSIIVNDVVFGVSEMFHPTESNVTRAVNAEFTSLTYQFIRQEYIVITLLGGLGVLHVSISTRIFSRFRRYVEGYGPSTGRTVRAHPILHTFAAASIVLLLLSFTPIDLIGVERIYSTAGIFLLPYTVFEAREMVDRIRAVTPASMPQASTVISMCLVALLLVNSGVMAATVTEGRSPQPSLDKERIVESGTNRQQYALYRSYVSPTDIAGTGWLLNHRVERASIVGGARNSDWMKQLFVTKYRSYHGIGIFATYDREDFGRKDSYLWIPEYSTVSRLIILQSPDEGALWPTIETTPLSELDIEQQDKVYTAGTTRVYWNGSRGDDNESKVRRSTG